jgi:hypothetical protein
VLLLLFLLQLALRVREFDFQRRTLGAQLQHFQSGVF